MATFEAACRIELVKPFYEKGHLAFVLRDIHTTAGPIIEPCSLTSPSSAPSPSAL
jgi:hypothetical protein